MASHSAAQKVPVPRPSCAMRRVAPPMPGIAENCSTSAPRSTLRGRAWRGRYRHRGRDYARSAQNTREVHIDLGRGRRAVPEQFRVAALRRAILREPRCVGVPQIIVAAVCSSPAASAPAGTPVGRNSDRLGALRVHPRRAGDVRPVSPRSSSTPSVRRGRCDTGAGDGQLSQMFITSVNCVNSGCLRWMPLSQAR
jgi:hypothetical protein